MQHQSVLVPIVGEMPRRHTHPKRMRGEPWRRLGRCSGTCILAPITTKYGTWRPAPPQASALQPAVTTAQQNAARPAVVPGPENSCWNLPPRRLPKRGQNTSDSVMVISCRIISAKPVINGIYVPHDPRALIMIVQILLRMNRTIVTVVIPCIIPPSIKASRSSTSEAPTNGKQEEFLKSQNSHMHTHTSHKGHRLEAGAVHRLPESSMWELAI